MSLRSHYDDIAQCNKCGFCQAACPIFRATGHESGVARGRLALLRALIEGRLDWTRELEEPLFNCLRCGACTANCFPKVPTADLLAEARGEYFERVGRSPVHRLLFDELLPHLGRLRLAAKAAAGGKNTGLFKAARALGMLRGFGSFVHELPRAEDLVERLPRFSFRERVKPDTYEGAGDLRLAYFVGCGMDLLCPDAAEATFAVLRQLGKTVTVLSNRCCGVPAYTYGDPAATRRLVRLNLELIDPEAFDAVATDCASCAAFLKKYPELPDLPDASRTRAGALAARTRDAVEILGDTLPPPTKPTPLLGAEGKPLVATYHDPCHAVRGQGLVKEPRALLKSLPGVEYRELPEADWCCGGAGSYALGHYDLSMQVLERKMDNVAKTGANLLVTACPACLVQLRHGVRRRGLDVRVCHLSELVLAQRS